MDYNEFIKATLKLEQAASARRLAVVAIEQAAVDALENADSVGAAAAIEALLVQQPGATRWWHELASVRMRDGDAAAAAVAWQRAMCCDLGDLPLLDRIGLALGAAGYDPASFAEQAWDLRLSAPAAPASAAMSYQSPGFAAACLDVLRQDWASALPAFQALQQSKPASRQAALNLAFVLERLDRHGQAQCVLAVNLLARGRAGDAVEAFEAVPGADAHTPEFLPSLLLALRLAGNEKRAICLAAAIPPGACPLAACLQWAEALSDLHQYEEAVEIRRQGFSEHGEEHARLLAELMLPPVPVSQAALEQACQRFARAAHALSATPLPESAEKLAAWEAALDPNFYHAYLSASCIEEARDYGHYVGRVMRARHPAFDESPPMRKRSSGERIRVGYATRFTTSHVVMNYFSGWLQHADRQAFELHLFPFNTGESKAADYMASLVDTCHASTTDTETAARAIHASDLDLLIYPEIGMDPLSFRLAALRLAPVQCAGAGHPVTTGLDTVDYFLSAAIAEPADAADHYSERLVGLPGSSVCMPLPELPAVRRSRADFGLDPGQIVYLSSQSTFKYLPCHDETFVRIAQSVGDAVFVFVEGKYPAWTRTLSDRLRRTFEARGLSPDRHLRFLPKQDYDSYLCLNAVSDVFLDPLGSWSGTTALDALACDLPVVTLPGPMMRNRQSFALLTQLGIEDTIATDVDDYLRIAIDLGRDAHSRAVLSRRIRDRRHVLFDDVGSVKALEAFIRWATGAPRPGDEALFKLWPKPKPWMSPPPGLPAMRIDPPSAPDRTPAIDMSSRRQ